MEDTFNPPAEAKPVIISELAAKSEAIRAMLEPLPSKRSLLNDKKIRRLYMQAASQQWFSPTKLNFDIPLDMEDEKRRILIQVNKIFYTLEKMGLSTILYMQPKAIHKLKSEESAFYLSQQAADEARHVFTIEAYLKKLGSPPEYDRKLHVFSQIATFGFYRVENWLFSTLFSENFASAFLRQYKAANTDPIGAEMSRLLLVDESRHLHFLHMILPDILDRLSLMGRSVVKTSQYFVMRITEAVSRNLAADAAYVGLDRRALLEDAFENVERAYEGFGVTRDFLRFPKIQ